MNVIRWNLVGLGCLLGLLLCSWALAEPPKTSPAPANLAAKQPEGAQTAPLSEKFKPLELDLLQVEFRLVRYHLYSDCIRELASLRQIPADKAEKFGGPYEGPSMNAGELQRLLIPGKRTRAEVLQDWSGYLDQKQRERVAGFGLADWKKIDARYMSPKYQATLFWKSILAQGLSGLQLDDAQYRMAWNSKQKLFDEHFRMIEKQWQAEFAASRASQPLPADPLDRDVYQRFRQDCMATVMSHLTLDQQRELLKAWTLLYPDDPPPELQRVAAAAPERPPERTATRTPAQPPASPSRPPEKPATTKKSAGKVTAKADLAGTWKTSKDGIDEIWTIKREGERWTVEAVYVKAGKQVGACHGEEVAFAKGELHFKRVFETRPRADMPDHAASKIAFKGADAELSVSADGQVFRKTLRRDK